MTVNQLLSKKGSQIYGVLPTTTVYEAVKVMCDHNIGAILIMEDFVLKGILTERDYARKVVLKDKTSKGTLVHEIMETNLNAVLPSDSIDYCMEQMSNNRVRHLPVIEHDRVVGMVSIGDIVKGIMEIQDNTISQLNSYITQ